MKEINLKMLHTECFQQYDIHSGKVNTMETVKSGCQELESKGGMNRQSTEDFTAMKLLCMLL